jgi:hypothetical protein
MTVPEMTVRRVLAMDYRIRIERVAMTAYSSACSLANQEKSGLVANRLAFLLVGRDDSHSENIYQSVRLARHVYTRTSDVLHGRVNMINVSQVEIEEWREVVLRLEATASRLNGP